MSLKDFLGSWLQSVSEQQHLDIAVSNKKKGIPSGRILDATEALSQEALSSENADDGLAWRDVNGNRHGDGINNCREATPLGVKGHRSHNNRNELTGSL